MNAIAVLGGSFNPLHVGHLRLAIEIHEAFGPLLERVDLLPTAHPPHKQEQYVLPFSVRVELVGEAVAPYPWLNCNPLEGERKSPSYTWETLRLYQEREPGKEIFFVLGSQDYTSLPDWYHGPDIPRRCTLVVAPRGFYRPEQFIRDTRHMWPDARLGTPLTANGLCMETSCGRIIFQPLPWLEVSASLIRERWLLGRCIDYLVPPGVSRMLESRREEIRHLWS